MKLTREHALIALIVAAATAGIVWLGMQMEWVEVNVPERLPKNMRRDPHEQLKRLATGLGAQVSTPQNLDQLPPQGATLVLSSGYWNLFPGRAEALRQWVEEGGDLWLPAWWGRNAALDWVPITRVDPARGASGAAASAAPIASAPTTATPCRPLAEPASVSPAFGVHRSFSACAHAGFPLRTRAPLQWALDGPQGHVLARIAVGRGSVTVSAIDGALHNDSLRRADHALIAVAALRLHAGQQLWLVSTEARPPVLSVLWQRGAPALVLAGVALLLALWRGGTRFGPRLATLPLARRSMAEQVRGTAAFAEHHRSPALQHAQLRALDEAARGRIAGYDRLDGPARAEAIALHTRLGAAALMTAMNVDANAHADRASAAAARVPARLALLETARRRLSSRQR